MAIWFFVWIAAAPLAVAAGVGAVVMVLFDKTRAVGRALSGATIVAATGLALLFANAYGAAQRRTPQVSDLVTPEQLAEEARLNGALSAAAMILALTATLLARRARKAP